MIKPADTLELGSQKKVHDREKGQKSRTGEFDKVKMFDEDKMWTSI